MEDIKIIYHDKEDFFLINYFNNNVLKKNNDKGKFTIENNILKILWNNEIIEEFIKNEKIYEDEIDTYSFLSSFLNQNIDNNKLLNNEINLIYMINDKIVEETFIINYTSKNIYRKNNNDDIFNIDINELSISILWDIDTNFFHSNNKKYYYSEYLLNNFFFKIIININNENYNYIIDTINFIVFDENNKNIFYNYNKIDEFKILIQNNKSKYYSIFEKYDNNIFYDVTIKYNEKINISHENWSEECIINIYNNCFNRPSNNECGNYELNDNTLIVYWELWDKETFININNIYYNKNNINDNIEENIIKEINIDEVNTKEVNTKEVNNEEINNEEVNNEENKIFIYHEHWTEYCIIKNNILYRTSDLSEYGKYIIENNKLKIYWEKWDEEIFYICDNNYYYDKFIIFINIDNIIYITNKVNNFIYDINNNILGSFNFLDNINNLLINWNNNENLKYIYKFKKDNIITYENIFKKIIIIKDFEEEYIINTYSNLIENELTNNNGTYKIEDDLIIIYWDNLLESNIYKLINNKYYYKNYLDYNDNNYLLLDTNNNFNIIRYKINFFEKILYNNNSKINFLENNNLYYLEINNEIKLYNLHIINENENNIKYYVLNNKNYNDELNYKIYKVFNKDLDNLTNLDLYINWIKCDIHNKIYSINSFLKKYYFFDIKKYKINNYIDNSEDAIIHWCNNGYSSIYFYSENIEMVYDNIEIDYDNIDFIYDNLDFIYDNVENNQLFNKSFLNKYLFSNENENQINNFNNLHDNTLFIINLEDSNDLENIIKYIPKESNIILNFNLKNDNFIVNKYKYFENILLDKYKNLILVKSFNLSNYEIIDYIQKNIIIYKNLCYDNIIYINSFFPNLYKIINNIKNYDVISNNNIIDLNNNKRIIINSIKNIYLIMFNYITNIVDLIIILIFYILTKKYIFYLLNNNFIIHINIFINIFIFDIRDKNLYFLDI